MASFGVAAVDVRPDVPVALPGRPAAGLEPVEERPAVPSGVTAMPSSVVRVSFDQTRSSGVVLAQPARLAEHRGRLALPVGRRPRVLRGRQVERALRRLQLLGLVQPTLDSHAANDRSAE